VRADLQLRNRGDLTVRWNASERLAEARLDGTIGGEPLRATMLAP